MFKPVMTPDKITRDQLFLKVYSQLVMTVITLSLAAQILQDPKTWSEDEPMFNQTVSGDDMYPKLV